MWQMLRVCGFGEKLLKPVQSFYADSRADVRVRMDVSEWFPANVELWQGCVMSPWMFMCAVYGWYFATVEYNCAGNAECCELIVVGRGSTSCYLQMSEGKWCRLVSEFGRVYRSRK